MEGEDEGSGDGLEGRRREGGEKKRKWRRY